MVIVDSPLSWADLKTMAERTFGDMVKAVVDIERGVDSLEIRAKIKQIVGRWVKG